ncbi:hypothetical protein ACO1FG_002272, partial [Neisseria gonorrhoeae]
QQGCFTYIFQQFDPRFNAFLVKRKVGFDEYKKFHIGISMKKGDIPMPCGDTVYPHRVKES